ncbi:helix-turn-helix transcriptional regulator [Pontiella desulfatans]|uniref:helix-turn-helix transcriptional regulator n=1 Tax=Pontiella desulfatans TaxID=2750659 RepID=UPI00109CE921|nr:helix-turn-helix domain-containing protein [Pontiella desulfatans]
MPIKALIVLHQLNAVFSVTTKGQEMKIEPKYLKTASLAKMLNVSPRFVRQLVADGRLPYIRIGARSILFDLDQVQNWIDDHRIGAA